MGVQLQKGQQMWGSGGGAPVTSESSGKQAKGQVSSESNQANCLQKCSVSIEGGGRSTLVGAGGSQRAPSHLCVLGWWAMWQISDYIQS